MQVKRRVCVTFDILIDQLATVRKRKCCGRGAGPGAGSPTTFENILLNQVKLNTLKVPRSLSRGSTTCKTMLVALLLLLLLSISAASPPTDRVVVNVAARTTPFTHYWKRAFGTGHATLTLRDDWRTALTQATTDLGLQGVRGHGIFDDDMGVVVAPRTYNFTLVEDSWRFQVAHNVTPIVELSFMPAILANCTWTAPTNGHVVNPGHAPCTTPQCSISASRFHPRRSMTGTIL
jgi:hypothetical protein